MNDALTLFLGPLAAPECDRASRRGWLIWVRLIPAIAAGVVAVGVLWLWWIGQQIDPTHQPFYELRIALSIIEGMMLTFAMIMTPALLAGSLAGDKERGSIGLLLTTRASSLDIVLGRLAGRLSQVAMIELAALPALLLIAWMAGFRAETTLTLIAAPAAVAFGGAGIALAASALSRRGRDALLFVYLLEILLLLSPLVGSLGSEWIGVLNPFATLEPLAWRESPGPALATSGVWAALGLAGLALASWRLRPACLAEGDESRARKRGKKRRGWVPPLDERPMLWKELHIEKVGTLGRAGRWIGGLLVAWLALGSLFLGGCAVWVYCIRPTDEAWADWAVQQSSFWYGNSALFIGFLIQWAIGLRAAVTISSERERGTWDALLTSPLEGTEIVRGKLWGSLWALKWLIGSALLAWTITFALGGMLWPEYVEQLVGMVVIGTFMSAVGVRTSLHSATATKAMGVTIGIWLGAWAGALFVAWAICLAAIIGVLIAWIYATQMGLASFAAGPWFPMTFRLGQDLVFYSEFVIGAVLIVAETRLRFDRVAGRMTGGQAAVAIDRLIHGIPMAPVRLDGRPVATEVKEMVGVGDGISNEQI